MSKKYMESGVDLEAGYESVRRIKSHVARTAIKGSIDSLGAFGGMFDLSVLNLKEPVLVSGTDGVGTKLMLAFQMDKHDSIGIDAVAMCVNDVLVQGAFPLFFLDYIAVGKNHPAQIEAIVKGVADGCVSAECALIGGETAEMPGMYSNGHYDIAGFTVGAVEKSKLITGKNVIPGDVIIGLPSSGVHSNGFSLVRKIIENKKLNLNKIYGNLEKTLGESLLEPTKIYVKAIKNLLNSISPNAMCHITGGGFYENVPRILPVGCMAEFFMKDIKTPEIFKILQEMGDVPIEEMYNVFNMGIGFMIVINPDDVEKTLESLIAIGEKPSIIGHIKNGEGVQLTW
ncbi:MAG: phosphoribosylformylglycinamidine cyclo-ligase [Fusobacteriaceae bacterium]